MNMKSNLQLISFASNFASFLFQEHFSHEIKKIILFGSVARGEATKDSDIDLFIDIDPKHAKSIKNTLELYRKSEDYGKFKLLGIENEIKLKIGNLEEWSSLQRSIISDGLILYGKYQALPKNLKQFFLFEINLEKLQRKKKVKFWRKLYGYKQKVGSKIYASEGLINMLKGKRIGLKSFMIPIENTKKIMEFLKKEKIPHITIEMWSDVIG